MMIAFTKNFCTYQASLFYILFMLFSFYVRCALNGLKLLIYLLLMSLVLNALKLF